jgi:HK97 family phage prohead protease
MGGTGVNEVLMREAAVKRAEGVRAPADRPRQRRCDSDERSRAWVSSRAQLEVRQAEDTGALSFEGFASVTGQGYQMWDWAGEYTEYVHVGAFSETLARADLDVPLVLDHVSSRRIARTGNEHSPLYLSEVTMGATTGLKVLAPTLDINDPDTAYIVPKLRSKLIDEMSFRFMITSGRWSDDWMEYHIHAVDIHRGDTAIVGYGANPLTAGSGLREQPAAGPSSQARMLLELSRADDDRRLTAR